jgi:hypothetical protein
MSHKNSVFLRLSPTSYANHYPNPFFVMYSEKTSSNRVGKGSTYFGLKERGNPNMRPLLVVSLLDPIAARIGSESRPLPLAGPRPHRGWGCMLGICPRGNHRDDDIATVSVIYYVFIEYSLKTTCID